MVFYKFIYSVIVNRWSVIENTWVQGFQASKIKGLKGKNTGDGFLQIYILIFISLQVKVCFVMWCFLMSFNPWPLEPFNPSTLSFPIKKPAHSGQIIRQRPTLPQGFPSSTIGAGGLNFSVRNGKRCYPSAIATGKRCAWLGPHEWVAYTPFNLMVLDNPNQATKKMTTA